MSVTLILLAGQMHGGRLLWELGDHALKIRHSRKTVAALHRSRADINLSPMWQRGLAWNPQKQVLLIDSILRGMDIPKIYFRANPQDADKFDVVDGQQRLRAIWKFLEDDLALRSSQPLLPIGSEEVQGKTFSQLSEHAAEEVAAFQNIPRDDFGNSPRKT